MSRARKIVGDSLTLGVRQVLTLGLVGVQTIVAARALGPAGFGTFAIISVLSMMAAVATPGFLAAAARELPHYRARGDASSEKTVLNHTVCGELLIAAVWSLVIAGVAALQETREIAICLLLVALAVIPARLVSLYQLVGYVEKDFDFQSRGALLVAALTCALVVGLIWEFRLYAVFLAPAMASAAGILFYRRRYVLAPRWGKLRKEEFVRLTKIGLPMSGLAVVSGNNGLQRWGERALLDAWLGPAALGIYAFCAWISLAFYALFGGLLQAFQPHVYELVSGELEPQQIDQAIVRPLWTVIVLAFLAVGLAVATLPGIIAAILPGYVVGIPALYLLLAGTLVGCSSWIPGIMMSAVRFDAQVRYLAYWCVAVPLSLGTGLILLARGWSITAIAIGYLVSQAVLMVLTFRFFWSYLFPDPHAFRSFLKDLVWPAANVAAAVAVVLLIGEFVAPAPRNAWASGIVAAAQGMVFTVLAAPTLVLLERRTSVYSAHVHPLLKKLFAR